MEVNSSLKSVTCQNQKSKSKSKSKVKILHYISTSVTPVKAIFAVKRIFLKDNPFLYV